MEINIHEKTKRASARKQIHMGSLYRGCCIGFPVTILAVAPNPAALPTIAAFFIDPHPTRARASKPIQHPRYKEPI